ncbi:uncharacterized protein Tgi isoform X1 [Diabrotica undecimpunctata]|uniref:uncharacterized protein Tgi isoform X1 n=1 Tax=Diabrotica undecimpunctata TaxID=50387 RepID=UPI003B641387
MENMDREVVQNLLRVSLMMRENEKSDGELKTEKGSVYWQPWLNDDDPTKPYTKHTTKWKRERRPRPPDYPRKSSDPKYSEFVADSPSPAVVPESNGVSMPDTPLDMSVRQRGLPPSYAQTISNPGYRSSYRPSVIHNGVPPAREELPSGISMCDPIIDEHFRRSLGNDYHIVFQNNNSSKDKEQSPPKSPPTVTTTTSVIELMDGTGLSVDEHFAKALGDTWTKLNSRKESEIPNGSSENGLVST